MKSQSKRFVNEARICGKLNHPQIVQIYESGIHEGIPFFAMEYMPGGSLQDILIDGPLEPRVAANVVRALTQAVAFAHSRAIVHRDLKPGNVLLAPAAGGLGIQLRPEMTAVELKISDFGLAKCLVEPGTQTRTGAPVGTPAYMAPEQIGSAQSVDGRCDVYSLGAMIYHLLVGKPPFQAATIIETLQLVQLEPPMPVRSMQPSVPRDLETICLKCLQKEPERRYASADALADDLQALSGGATRRSPTYRHRRAFLALGETQSYDSVAGMFRLDCDHTDHRAMAACRELSAHGRKRHFGERFRQPAGRLFALRKLTRTSY